MCIERKARFPFKRNRLRCVRCLNENRKKRKCLRWQAGNHGCHCFDRAFLLAGACVSASQQQQLINNNDTNDDDDDDDDTTIIYKLT